jgi:hypothetical protein
MTQSHDYLRQSLQPIPVSKPKPPAEPKHCGGNRCVGSMMGTCICTCDNCKDSKLRDFNNIEKMERTYTWRIHKIDMIKKALKAKLKRVAKQRLEIARSMRIMAGENGCMVCGAVVNTGNTGGIRGLKLCSNCMARSSMRR